MPYNGGASDEGFKPRPVDKNDLSKGIKVVEKPDYTVPETTTQFTPIRPMDRSGDNAIEKDALQAKAQAEEQRKIIQAQKDAQKEKDTLEKALSGKY